MTSYQSPSPAYFPSNSEPTSTKGWRKDANSFLSSSISFAAAPSSKTTAGSLALNCWTSSCNALKASSLAASPLPTSPAVTTPLAASHACRTQFANSESLSKTSSATPLSLLLRWDVDASSCRASKARLRVYDERRNDGFLLNVCRQRASDDCL